MTDTGDPRPSRTYRFDGGSNGPDDADDFEDEGSGRRGFWFRIFPGRDPKVRSLTRQLRQADAERAELQERIDELQHRIDELKRENEDLESTKEGYEQRQFRMDALLRSVGRSFEQASDDLAEFGVTVGDLDVTLHADVSGGGQRDTLDLRLVEPDEEIDPERLSTISFSVGRRGRLRHYGHPGTQRSAVEGPLGAGPAGEDSERDDVTDTDAGETPSRAPPVEVPNVNGLPAEEATQELTDAGFEVHTEYRSDETPVGKVGEQWPRAFAVAPRESSVVLFVGGEQGGN
jgi:FtsZ-binding cell division protein ZapB